MPTRMVHLFPNSGTEPLPPNTIDLTDDFTGQYRAVVTTRPDAILNRGKVSVTHATFRWSAFHFEAVDAVPENSLELPQFIFIDFGGMDTTDTGMQSILAQAPPHVPIHTNNLYPCIATTTPSTLDVITQDFRGPMQQVNGIVEMYVPIHRTFQRGFPCSMTLNATIFYYDSTTRSLFVKKEVSGHNTVAGTTTSARGNRHTIITLYFHF